MFQEEAGRTDRVSFLWRRLRRAAPTVLVLAALAGLGYFGHHTGWKIPKFSQLTGSVLLADQDWCIEHGVPESICVACDASLMPKGKLHGWCKEHGVAECPWHHGEMAQLSEPPQISPADLDRARRALALKQRPKNDPACQLHLRRIQFASREAVDKVGIDIALVDRAPIVEAVFATGEIAYDPTRVARLSSRTAGTVWRVDKSVGESVQTGEVVALVDAAEVGRAKAELLQAVTQLDLQTKTYRRLAHLEGVVPGRRLLEAETAQAAAEIAVHKAIQALVNLGLPISRADVRDQTADQLSRRIQFLGLSSGITAQLDARQTTTNLIPVIAHRDGIVVTRDVVAGEVIDRSETLLTVVDTSEMWLLLDVRLEDAEYVRLGQRVFFHPDGSADNHAGTATWISTEVDPETRTVKVRAELPNADRRLRNESFGAGQIVLREEQDAIVAPVEAIHWEGCCHVAFVRDKDYFKKGSYTVFHTRMVRPGVTHGGITEVIAGLLPGEVVVTLGSDVLRAELLKGNLGAG